MATQEDKSPLRRRWWKVWPFPQCCLPCNLMLHPCRAGVSQNKRRYQKDGFDLDLTYVTSRIIVHGFPAAGVEHIYRNPRTEVQRLLDKYHTSHYKVYNFTNEPGRTYPPQLFQGPVERFPFSDHTCPPLESVVDFCENAKAWLDSNAENVVALHCKAGKGRAGIMASCLMVRQGQTAHSAVAKYNGTRVSDFKGLTVVNQRKWVFMYERFVREVWGLHDNVKNVPGQDPGLRAPSPKTVAVREISVQLQATTITGKRNDGVLPNISCAIYQQKPMGKTLVHRCKMVPSVRREGELGLVYTAALPRGSVVKDTFQVLISAAVGKAATQKKVMDLWWNTIFLASDGGDQVFEVSEMDLFSRVKTRLHRSDARIILCHTHPGAACPEGRTPLPSNPSDSGEPVAKDSESGESAKPPQPPSNNDGAGREESLPEGLDPSPSRSEFEQKYDTADTTTNSQQASDVPAEGSREAADAAAGGKSKGYWKYPDGGDTEGFESNNEASMEPLWLRGSSEMTGSRQYNSGPQASTLDLPGPSPAVLASLAWTFESRMPSSNGNPMAKAGGDSKWSRTKMWSGSQGLSSSAISTPAGSSSRKKVGPAADRSLGLRVARRAGQPKHSEMDHAVSDYSRANSSTSGRSVNNLPTGGSASQGGWQGKKGFSFPMGRDTDTESEDQVAVGASAFGGWSAASGRGRGRGRGVSQRISEHDVAEGTPATLTSTPLEQYSTEMEVAFGEERKRWEEHRHCLETELDWALAARARAEARSEENNARMEVLENRLSSWRGEYTVIEQDVKQAVKLLEMSLSGLMSAENALRKWKDQIPPKAYEDIMACLTKGSTPQRSQPAVME